MASALAKGAKSNFLAITVQEIEVTRGTVFVDIRGMGAGGKSDSGDEQGGGKKQNFFLFHGRCLAWFQRGRWHIFPRKEMDWAGLVEKPDLEGDDGWSGGPVFSFCAGR